MGKKFNIEPKEYKDYWVARGRLGELGTIITQGKNLTDACGNLVEALSLAIESFGGVDGD